MRCARDKQIWVGAVATGSTGKSLNSTYANRDTIEYKDELGVSILTICQTMIGNNCIGGLPPAAELTGGVLVFFPSYGVMDSAIARWKETGLFNRLIVAGGNIVIEPQGSAGNAGRGKAIARGSAIGKEDLNKKRNSGETTSDLVEEVEESDVLKGIVGEFEATLKRSRRCILLAVCRGKVSEGIDFSDERGRVVIITGKKDLCALHVLAPKSCL
jgi:fanconi anemia group J protein